MKYKVIIPYYENIDLLENCLDSIQKHPSGNNISVVLVDDCSNTPMDFNNYPIVENVLRLTERSGFTKAVNAGMKYCFENNAESVILLNSDMEVCVGTFDELIAFSQQNKNAGLVGGMELSMIDPSKIINAGTRPLYKNGKLVNLLDIIRQGEISDDEYTKAEPLDWVSFGIVLITKECYEKVGPMDPQFLNYFSDTDFCHRARLENFEIWFNPRSKVFHKQHQTTKIHIKKNLMKLQEDRERYYSKWLPAVHYERNDRYWNTTIKSNLKNWFPKVLPHYIPSTPFINQFSPLKENYIERQADLQQLMKFTTWNDCDFDDMRTIRRLYLDGFLFLEQKYFRQNSLVFMDDNPLVIFSPHADDVALSIGGLMLSRRGTMNETRICTFFNRSNHTVPIFEHLSIEEKSLLRNVEEASYCSYIQADYQIFNLSDRLVREPQKRIFLNDISELDHSLVEQIKDIITTKTRYYKNCLVMCPLAAGLMEDHAAVAVATCELIKENVIPRRNVLIYDDIPYASSPENINKGIEIFKNYGMELHPQIFDTTVWFEQKRELLQLYKSQLNNYFLEAIDTIGLNMAKKLKGEAKEQNWRRAERIWTIHKV